VRTPGLEGAEIGSEGLRAAPTQSFRECEEGNPAGNPRDCEVFRELVVALHDGP
jgi:hypothetical protein